MTVREPMSISMGYSYTCSFDGCDRVSSRKSYCVPHRKQLLAGEPLAHIPRRVSCKGTVCSYPECGRPFYAKGLCRPHRNMVQTGVELHAVGDKDFIGSVRRKSWENMTEEAKAHRLAAMHAVHYTATEEYLDRKSAEVKTFWANGGPVMAPRACITCTDIYTPNSGSHQYCSLPCRNLAYRAKRYGMKPTELKALLHEADGKCELCKRESESLHIDHDHATGKVRGIICVTCNTGIGKLGENAATLRAAADYLERV